MSRPSETPLFAREPTSFARPQPDPVNGWSPNPTRGPELVFGSIDNNQLFGRQNTQLTDPHICGWVSGLSRSPLSCPNQGGSTTYCGYLVQSGSPYNVWCCPYTTATDGSLRADFDECPWITSCLPYSDSQNTNSGSYILRDTTSHVISCPSQEPECTTIFLQGPSTTTYLQYGCGATSSTYLAFQSYTVQTTVSTSSRPSSTSSTSSAPTSNVGMSSSTMSSATSSPTSTDSGSSTNVGAIAGGTIGGVAAVAVIAGVIGWLIYRKRAARRPQMREVSQYTGSSY